MNTQDRQEPLPLSWVRSQAIRPAYRDIPLPFSTARWITWAEIPEDYSAAILHEDLALTYPGGFLFRGCPTGLAAGFTAANCHTFNTGYEAVLDLDGPHLNGKRVRGALSRGSRHGKVVEVVLNEPNRMKLSRFRQETRHSGKPQLRHLFRDSPDHTCRCFVFSDQAGRWLAAMTLSKRGGRELHTELLLRHNQAPGDIMECLGAGICAILKGEGMQELSLGEVPFMMLADRHAPPPGSLELFMLGLMARMKHAYDFEGLYRFKNKFAPMWRPVMLCTTEEPSALLLTGLAMAMGYTDLLVHESVGMVRQWFDN